MDWVFVAIGVFALFGLGGISSHLNRLQQLVKQNTEAVYEETKEIRDLHGYIDLIVDLLRDGNSDLDEIRKEIGEMTSYKIQAKFQSVFEQIEEINSNVAGIWIDTQSR